MAQATQVQGSNRHHCHMMLFNLHNSEEQLLQMISPHELNLAEKKMEFIEEQE